MKKRPIKLLIVDDEEAYRNLLSERFTMIGDSVALAATGEEAIEKIRREPFDVGILDLRMPGMDGIDLFKKLKELQPISEIIFLTGQATVDVAIEAMKLGAYDFLTKPCQLSELQAVVHKAYEKKQLAEKVHHHTELQMRAGLVNLVGETPAMKNVKALITRVAPTESTVLIEGESGTGKEIVANSIHQNSLRSKNPFVIINCGAVPETLLESELFGHEKGAFTGAIRRKSGLFEIADSGTLFIDEVSEMSPGMQVKLLRVLETGRFRRVGDTKEIEVDVRVLCATNKTLLQEAAEGRFREDLFYRINVMSVALSPLRERLEDIPLLVRHFIRSSRHPQSEKIRVADEVIEAFLNYDWPGNVRELSNVIERAIILSNNNLITLREIPQLSASSSSDSNSTCSLSLNEVEKRHIKLVLQAQNGNKTRAAKILGISRPKLYRKMLRYDIPDTIQPQHTASHD
ncbi:MAG: sigma-54-dependent Fis family transcriptional regulator [Candidatus Abyssobacteria bacterium SURF_5]|uniref:Sigma-54-dependent Fis family transcriptional regulator n=1 Tax=Abyssobacteria bacterium (strain SURF_5) TaxID=2093360 RepID=A0A3A4N3U0_ABYX5|nr:MAG: sigma-54-dependent Fis family transcriptional regulator [Candidatus Abyssubacteria bacterium SURF_5]